MHSVNKIKIDIVNRKLVVDNTPIKVGQRYAPKEISLNLKWFSFFALLGIARKSTVKGWVSLQEIENQINWATSDLKSIGKSISRFLSEHINGIRTGRLVKVVAIVSGPYRLNVLPKSLSIDVALAQQFLDYQKELSKPNLTLSGVVAIDGKEGLLTEDQLSSIISRLQKMERGYKLEEVVFEYKKLAANNNISSHWKALIYEGIARVSINLGRISEAYLHARMASEIYKPAGEFIRYINCERLVALAVKMSGDAKEAIKQNTKLLSLLNGNTKTDKFMEAHLRRDLGSAYAYLLKNSKNKIEKERFSKLAIEESTLSSRIIQENFVDKWWSAEKIGEFTRDDSLMWVPYRNIGKGYLYRGNITKAVNEIEEAIKNIPYTDHLCKLILKGNLISSYLAVNGGPKVYQ